MSYLLEILGRGRLGQLRELFDGHMLPISDDDLGRLRTRLVEDPERADLHARLGVAMLQRCRLAEAIDAFTHAVRREPDHLAGRLGLACCFEQQDRIDEAIEQLELGHANLPGDPALLLALGYCLERSGRTARAAECYRDLLNRAPRTAAARERLAAIELAGGNAPAAVEQYEQLRDQGGRGDARVRLALGNLYLQAGRPADAVGEFADAIALGPENWSARRQAADALVADGRIADAVEHLEALLVEQGDAPDLHVQLGDLRARLGEDACAAACYSRALELDGDYLEAAVKLATQHLRAGRFADAAVGFNRAVGISDRTLTAYAGLAVAQKNAGQWSAAADTLQLAGQLAPNSTLLFREMARLELKAALARQGEAAFTAQSARDPGGPAAGGAGADGDAEDWDELLDYQIARHRHAVRERPNHADLHYRLGLLLLGQGDLGGAIEQFTRAVQINPNYTKARVKLGLALADAGLGDRAAEELSASLELDPKQADVHYRLGLLFAGQERFAAAADAFERSLAINGAAAEVRANLAACLESMGLLDRAGEHWQRLADSAPADSPAALRARRRLERPR